MSQTAIADDVPADILSAAAMTALNPTESPCEPRIAASPPIPNGDGVVFTFEAPDAHCVQLAADFNGWVTDGNEMQSIGRIWKKVVPLPPGRYQYRYVVDGGWQTDPLNFHVEPSPWGGYNSVLVLEGNDRQPGAQETYGMG